MPTKLKKKLSDEQPDSVMGQLLTEEPSSLAIPQVGQIISGTVITATKKEVVIDLAGYGVGVVRGPQLYRESAEYADLHAGDIIEATIVEPENESGNVELSFRYAGHQKVWDALAKLRDENTIVSVDIIEANRGGLMIKLNKIPGFLPVSQLSPEHYPRVPGGDKNKILEKLKSYVGIKMDAKVITLSPDEEKLIVSEKAAWEEQQHSTLAKYQPGDTIDGTVTAITDFGAFVEFGEKLEGLVHISELAWQRIDHPRDVVVVGQQVQAKILNIQGSKIFLSMKSLIDDPWKDVGTRYQAGQIVKGKVLKINPFGLFVELDKEIHGLAHVSELTDKPINDVSEIAKPGDTLEFRIVSVEPEQHRLGLSIKQVKNPKTTETPAAESDETAKKEPPAEATPAEATPAAE